MHNCKIALDIIWLDKAGKVVEVVASAPPCQKEARDCPTYGGHELAFYVLELGAGVAKAHADGITIAGHDGGTGASPLS